jgi:hypothetical protein
MPTLFEGEIPPPALFAEYVLTGADRPVTEGLSDRSSSRASELGVQLVALGGQIERKPAAGG